MNGATAPLLLRQRLTAYAGIAQIQARTQFAYRADFLFALIGLLVQTYLLKVVWTAVFPHSGAVSAAGGRSVTLAAQIAYATLAMVQYWLFNPWRLSLIPDRVREGKVAVDLARPIRFTAQMFCAQVGTTLAMAPFAVIALPFAVLVGGMQAPASPGAAGLYVLSLVLAYLITVLLAAIVSMVAFWTIDASGIFIIYRMVAQFFAGALVPLWFMPEWLATVANWLPFQSTIYTPLAIYLGQLGGPDETATALGVQCVWVLVLWLALRLVWSRALRRVVVQGG
ncbi:MAG: ABC-2 family transporter protein [Actinocatenispora sp.]